MSSLKTKGFLISFLVGGAVGSVIALLYTPKSGRHLRNDISRKTNEFIEESKKITSDTWNGAKEIAESHLDNANDFLNTGVEKIMRKTEKLKGAFKSGINAYNEERKSGSKENSSAFEDAGNIHGEIT